MEDSILQTFDKNEFKGFIKKKGNKLTVHGKLKKHCLNKITKINYLASDPPENNYSYYGSGMPYHNFEQATTKKINIGVVDVIDNEFKFKIQIPNSYYEKLGTVYRHPTIFLKSDLNNKSKYENIKLKIEIPYRYLSHPAIEYYKSSTSKYKLYKPSSPMFYNIELPNRSQEQILRDSDYPCNRKMPSNYWGLKPSL